MFVERFKRTNELKRFRIESLALRKWIRVYFF